MGEKKPISPPGPIVSAGAVIVGQQPVDIKDLNDRVIEKMIELRQKSKKI